MVFFFLFELFLIVLSLFKPIPQSIFFKWFKSFHRENTEKIQFEKNNL